MDNFVDQADSFLPSTEDFITELFYRVDTICADAQLDPLALLWPGEVVTLAMLFAIKGSTQRAFYRWASRDLRGLFPKLPERTRLFRLFVIHSQVAERCLKQPTFFGIADSYGIELIQSRRLGRSDRQIAKRGYCAGKWIAGVKAGFVLNSQGQICAWDVTTANTYDANAFAPLIEKYADSMIVLADSNFHKSPHHRKDDPDPPNVKICPRGKWGQRRLIETVLSMLTTVSHFKHMTERAWHTLRAHIAYLVAAYNLLTSWDGQPRLSIAKFSL